MVFRMGVRRKQLHALDRRLLLVVVEPVLIRLEGGDDGVARGDGVP